MTPCGYEQITDVSEAVGLTVPSNAAGQLANYAIITPDDPAGPGARWIDDGTEPTDSVGYPLDANSELQYDGALSAIRFIQTSAGLVLNVSYYYA
jgi:hypothetical protein